MAYTSIPNDPMMFLSFINTKLRDEYDSLSALCDDLELNQADILGRLSQINYTYDETLNRFL